MSKSEKIIIQVQVNDKGATAKLGKVTKATKELSVEEKANLQVTKELNAEKQREAVLNNENYIALQKAKIANLNLVKQKKNLALQTSKATKATMQGKTQTGLNNAILTEAGRTASDAAYGMQGMANNMGQLLTLISQHVETKGGFIASMKELGKSLFGVGGFLIALQLLISYLPQIQKWFQSFDSGGFVKSMNNNTESLKHMSKQLSDQNISIEDRKLVLDTLKRTNKELYDLMVKDGKLQKDSNKTMSTYIRMLEEQERLKQKDTELTKEISDIEEEDFALRKKLRAHDKDASNEKKRAMEKIKRAREEGSKLYVTERQAELDSEGRVIQVLKQREVSEKEYARLLLFRLKGERKAILEEINVLNVNKDRKLREVDEAQKRITKLRQEIGLDKEKTKGKGKNLLAELKKKLKAEAEDFEDDLGSEKIKRQKERYKKELEAFGLRNNDEIEELLSFLNEKIEIELDSEKKARDKKEEAEKRAENKLEIDRLGALVKDKFDFENQTKWLVKKEEERFRLIMNKYEKNSEEYIELEKALQDKIEAIRDRKAPEKPLSDTEKNRRKKHDAAVDYAKKSLDTIGDLLSSSISSELAMEEAKTNNANNQLKERLKNENLSAEERKQIQAKIAANDLNLAKKKNALAKKQFKLDKALAISSTIIDTYASAVGVMRDTKGGFFKRLAAALPTIAFGLAQVAMIAKQKFVPSALPSGSASSGGTTPSKPPQFNIVGDSGTNQLANAISEVERKPQRAYVVSSDISNAQEFDRKIEESASI